MRHPFDGIISDRETATHQEGRQTPAPTATRSRRAFFGRLLAGAAAAVACGAARHARADYDFEPNLPGRGQHPQSMPLTATRFSLNEEGGRQVTTYAIGEEGGTPTTLMTGEEGGATTQALGEEGGGVTTYAIGEEGGTPTTLMVGEEGGATTRALGEEGGGSVTTYALGEEGGGGVTTYALGEEGGLPPSYVNCEQGGYPGVPQPYGP